MLKRRWLETLKVRDSLGDLEIEGRPEFILRQQTKMEFTAVVWLIKGTTDGLFKLHNVL